MSLLPLVLAGLMALSGPIPAAPSDSASFADSIPSLEARYSAYVVAESQDLVHRIEVGPQGARVVNTVAIEELLVDTDGPHGVAVDPSGRYAYVSTGHGVWNGNLWKLEVGPDTAVAGPLALGQFPATVGVDPQGLFGYVANFNLHGEMVPSSISVVYLPDFVEVARTETCTMPHGSRVSPDGTRHYSVCMMDDQLVELETRGFTVHRRFHLDPEDPRPLPAHQVTGTHSHHEAGHDPACSPTWATPSPDGGRIYVACNAADRILEIDTEDWSLLRTIETGRGPYNLEVTPDDSVLVVTLKQGDGVQFFDVGTGGMLAQVATSSRVPHGVAISPDSRLAFISVEGIGTEPGRVDVFDLFTLERIHSLEVGLQAAGIAVLGVEPIS